MPKVMRNFCLVNLESNDSNKALQNFVEIAP